MKYSSKVPQTKEEVIEHFKNYDDEFFASCLIGIFECRLGMGEDVMLAYENALRAGAGLPAIETPNKGLHADTATPTEAGESS